MAQFNTTASNPLYLDQAPAQAPAGFMLRLGRREMQIRREVRKNHYSVNPIIDCRPGEREEIRRRLSAACQPRRRRNAIAVQNGTSART